MARLYPRNLGSKQQLEQDAVHDTAKARLAAEKLSSPPIQRRVLTVTAYMHTSVVHRIADTRQQHISYAISCFTPLFGGQNFQVSPACGLRS